GGLPPTPLGGISVFLGRDGWPGGEALVMMAPPEALASCPASAACWAVSVCALLWAILSWALALSRAVDFAGRALILLLRVLALASRAFNCVWSVLIWPLICALA